MEHPNDGDQHLAAKPIPVTPEDLPQIVEYIPETDTLWLGNGGPASLGTDIFLGVIAFLDNEARMVNGLMIDGAKGLLLPVLFGASEKNGQVTIDYDGDADTLSLWNGDETGIVLENAKELLRPYLFPEQSPPGR